MYVCVGGYEFKDKSYLKVKTEENVMHFHHLMVICFWTKIKVKTTKYVCCLM